MHQDDLEIKEMGNSLFYLLKKSKVIGDLTLKDNEVILTFKDSKDEKYKHSFFTLFAHAFFQSNVNSMLYYENQTFLAKDIGFLSKYKTLLFDIDDTILNFHKAERKALRLALESLNVQVNEKMLKHYHQINLKYWKMVEKNIISRDECLILRFEEFLPCYHLQMSASDFENLYRYYLNQQSFVIKNARYVLSILKRNYRIYAITNGVKETQEFRMNKAKMKCFFIKSFVSEVIGASKPSIEFFHYVENNIDDFDKKTTLIIGDSLSSDIQLGLNSQIDTCWFNYERKENKSLITPTYEIHSLLELLYFN